MIIDAGSRKNFILCALFGLMVVLFIMEQTYPSWISPAKQDRARALDSLISTFVLSGGCFASLSFLMRKNLRKKRELQAMNEELVSANDMLRERTEKLEQALGEIRELNQLLPICSHCKKIRDDDGYWVQIEKYFQQHGQTTFSHGICPECAKTFYTQYAISGNDHQEPS